MSVMQGTKGKTARQGMVIAARLHRTIRGRHLRGGRSHHRLVTDHPILSWISTMAEEGTALAAACTGTFFLAESGMLDGLRATTSWWLGPAFRKRYPAVELNETFTLIHDGRVTTAGAAFAHIDLALSIVRQQSPAPAELVSRHLLTGDRPSQARGTATRSAR